jgi:UDP-N-acetylglucosamine acyltransferase
MVAQDGYGRPRGINAEGLKRRGFAPERIAAIKRAYRALYMSTGSMDDARARLAALAGESEDVRDLLAFVDAAERPLLR